MPLLPKGVGLAEIPGTVCPFPRLIEQVARLEGIDAQLVIKNGKIVEKKKGLCYISFKIK